MSKTHFLTASGSGHEFAGALSGYSYGAPMGNVFFVNSASSKAADTAGSGYSPEAPFATLAFAITQATASNDDVIVLLPGHSETLTAAGAVTVSKAGLRIVGLGTGRVRPVINYTTSTAASFDITAANVRVENVVFKPLGIDAVVAAVNVSAADAQFINCEFELANATNQAVLGILTTASADRLLVQDCFFHGSTDAGTTAAVCLVGGDSIRLLNNVFTGAYSSGVGAIQQITTSTTNCIVRDNLVQNFTASCTKAMVFTASSTGQISGNRMQILSGTAPITGAAISWVGGNYYAAAVATAGTLI
jgi:hypothetical protein